jgi:hypothetical protein
MAETPPLERLTASDLFSQAPSQVSVEENPNGYAVKRSHPDL